jgi:ribosomal protein S6E (S10)
VNLSGDRLVSAGDYRLRINGGQSDSGAEIGFSIHGAHKLPE